MQVGGRGELGAGDASGLHFLCPGRLTWGFRDAARQRSWLGVVEQVFTARVWGLRALVRWLEGGGSGRPWAQASKGQGASKEAGVSQKSQRRWRHGARILAPEGKEGNGEEGLAGLRA